MVGPVRDPLDGACYMAISDVLYVTRDLCHWVRVPTDIERRHAAKLLGIKLPVPPRASLTLARPVRAVPKLQ